MKRDAKDGTDEDGSSTAPEDRRSRQRVDDRQRSGRGSATALSRLKMLERRYQLPRVADSPEKR